MLESCLVAPTNIVFHSETRESDPQKRLLGVELLYQIDSIAIGQSQVADEHIKLLVAGRSAENSGTEGSIPGWAESRYFASVADYEHFKRWQANQRGYGED